MFINYSKSLLINYKLVKLKFINPKRFLCDNASKSPLSILFYGSDDFSLESLRLLKKKLLYPKNESERIVKSLEVITTSENNIVYNYCKKSDLNCYLFDRYTLPNDCYDLGVVSSFGRLIPEKSISACKFGMLNIHGSLLPRWRGASPIQRAIQYGDKQTGVTIMTVKPKKFDVGQIVAQKRIDILYRLTSQELRSMMAPVGAELLWQCIENLEESLAKAYDQPEIGVTYAPKIREHEGEIDWETMDSRDIDRRTRAFVGCIDMTTQWIDGTTLKLYDPVDPDLLCRLNLNETLTNCEHTPGLVYYHKKRHLICIASANNTWSAFRTIALKGRKKMSGLGFYNTFMRPLRKQAKLNHCPPPIFIVGKYHVNNQNRTESFDSDHSNSSNKSNCTVFTDELKN